MKPIRSLLVALAGLVIAASAAAEVVVVVNPRNTLTAMEAEQVAQIYTGASRMFPNGSPASPVDQAEGSAVREEFLAKVVGRSSAQIKAVWSRLIFSGKGSPPKALASSAEVKKLVATEPNAIGFMERSAVDDTVKVVLTVK